MIRPTVLLLFAGALSAVDAVTATVTPMTFTVGTKPMGSRGSKAPNGDGYYPLRGVKPTLTETTVDVVVLDNGLVEAWVVPAWAGRLLRARDKRTGADYFAYDPTPIEGFLPWNPGGVKSSFPFFEHGTHLDQPAGYRIVHAADGAVTVACDLRFTQHAAGADRLRYGRFGDEALGLMVTVRPGSTVVDWRQRKDNPNPLPRGDRLWNDTSFPLTPVFRTEQVVDQKTGQTVAKEVPDLAGCAANIDFLFPARWVVDHGPTHVHTSPHWSALSNWNVSHFAIDAPYGFTGGWYPREDRNRLRINDTRPGHGAAVKLWSAPGRPLFEIWGGEGIVFEKPGHLQPAYRPVEFTNRFWVAQGIGAVDFATADAAVGVEGTAFALVASRAARAEVRDDTGVVVASGAVDPWTPLTGTFSGRRLAVALDGVPAFAQDFPLDRPLPVKETAVPPAIAQAFAELTAPDPQFFEKQCVGRNEGQPGLTDALDAARKVVDGSEPQQAQSLARAVFRLGRLDEAERLCRLAPGPRSDYLLGLIAWERGQAVDFAAAGWEADYLRALLAVQRGNRAEAVTLVDRYLAEVPDAWYPRLARAFWVGDAEAARGLASGNPASPEAQVVLALLGQPNDVAALLTGNPHADIHLAIFRDQLERGAWRSLPRYPLP